MYEISIISLLFYFEESNFNYTRSKEYMLIISIVYFRVLIDFWQM